MSPKPRQLMIGKVREGGLGLDVVGCRMYGLGSNGSPLPRFNLLDKPESYDASKTYHFYYVDAGVVTTAEELYDRLPYTGPGWYWRAAWDMPGFPKDKTTHGLRASEACPPELLADAFELIVDCVETVYPPHSITPEHQQSVHSLSHWALG